MFRKLFDFLTRAIASAVFYSLMGIFVVIGWALIQFYSLIQLFGYGPEPPDPAMVDEVERIYRALEESDIKFLEDYAKLHPNFPHSTDDWLERHWLTNAIDCGSVASIRWILDQGVDANYNDDEGFSPLKSVLQREYDSKNREWGQSDAVEIIDMLLAAGADINAKGTLDVTALHNAAAWGSAKMVRHLLDRGANPDAMDRDFVPGNPLSYVNKRKHPEIAALLESHMGVNQGP